MLVERVLVRLADGGPEQAGPLRLLPGQVVVTEPPGEPLHVEGVPGLRRDGRQVVAPGRVRIVAAVHDHAAGRFDPALEPKLGRLLVSVAADITADLRDSGFIRDA